MNRARTTKTYFSATYRRLARRGPMKALVAVEHAMIIAAWHMLTNGELPRAGPRLLHPTRPTKTKARAVKQLEALGYDVTLQPVAHAR